MSDESSWPRILFFCFVIGAVAIIFGSVFGGAIVIGAGVLAAIDGICEERKRLREAREREKQNRPPSRNP